MTSRASRPMPSSNASVESPSGRTPLPMHQIPTSNGSVGSHYQQSPNANANKSFKSSTSRPAKRMSPIWAMVMCTIFGYGLCQLDLGVTLLGAPRKNTIQQISVIGERNSGTRWTWGHISACFNHSIEVRTKLTRYKHWFQYPGYYRYPHDTLVIAQFRNPYDWLKAMQHVPHHAPAHLQYRADEYWKEFLSTPWTMERVGTDRWNNLTEPCQEHFAYKDVISCPVEPLPKSHYGDLHYSEHQPLYEMKNDGSGKPYDNIMELRSDKIRNFLSVKQYEGIADVWIVQYECLLTKGTAELIQQIADWTGLTPKCNPMPPQQRRNRPVEKDMAEYIRDNLNWTVESWIGYGPHQS